MRNFDGFIIGGLLAVTVWCALQVNAQNKIISIELQKHETINKEISDFRQLIDSIRNCKLDTTCDKFKNYHLTNMKSEQYYSPEFDPISQTSEAIEIYDISGHKLSCYHQLNLSYSQLYNAELESDNAFGIISFFMY